MRGPYAEFLLLFGLLLLCSIATTICFAFNLLNSEVTCIAEERLALLKFKRSFGNYYDDQLPSWSNHEEDCCKWKGIKCCNRTGHVVTLVLEPLNHDHTPLALGGEVIVYIPNNEISSSLLGLQHLTYLDLSRNLFTILPKFIGSLTKLQYLNLSYNGISGTIPPQLGNLSSLISLDLSGNDMLIEDHNLDWLVHLSSLRHLDMSQVNLSKVVNWQDKVNMLPSLLHLRLSSCELSMPVTSVLFNANSSPPLSLLDLSHNHLNSSIFPWLFKYTDSLVVLDLSFNKLKGSIPKAFGNMVALVQLNLSANCLEGLIPDLTKLSLLTDLRLSNNHLNGSLDNVLGKLFKLQVLDVSLNNFTDVITEAHLSNLSTLRQLDFSSNSLSLKFSPNWIPPFHLDTIKLRSCNLGPAFPQWIQTQRNFSWLDMSDVGITGTIPNWFWDLSSNIKLLNISHNQITGTIHLQWFLARFNGSYAIDLSYNHFSGALPQITSDPAVLNLSNNLFQGTITFMCETYGSLAYLDLSNNLLFGELPNCWANMSSLEFLNLANNNLSGRIPESFGRICWIPTPRIFMLHFQNNNFIGKLPVSLINCSSLMILDFGENRLSGRIPTWIGTSLRDLVVLRLPSNMFVGSIPLQLCQLKSLQILDLSNNNISGTIPWCLNHFTAMAQKQSLETIYFDGKSIFYGDFGFTIDKDFTYFLMYYVEHVAVNTKGEHLEYGKNLGLVKAIDLSSNKLKGEIPRNITSLLGLIGLNLSRNMLSNIIPQNIGGLQSLESLDLSNNHLFGVIPSSLTNLSFLSYLNLSDNNLSGRIPTGTQLQSFNASSYASNRDLCGLPLLKKCNGDEAAQGPQIGSRHGEGNIQEQANSHEHLWFYTSIAIGFIVGFWGVCGSLVLKSSWRYAYFQFLDRMGDKLSTWPTWLRNFKTVLPRKYLVEDQEPTSA